MKTICFLLSGVECRSYHNLGLTQYLDSLEHTSFEGSLFKLHLGGDPLKDADNVRNLARALGGWDEVLEISEEEHDLISNAIK